MTLPATDTRCLGQLPTPFGEMACTKRQTCARYVQRYEAGARSFAQFLCPSSQETGDDFYSKFIPEVAASTATT